MLCRAVAVCMCYILYTERSSTYLNMEIHLTMKLLWLTRVPFSAKHFGMQVPGAVQLRSEGGTRCLVKGSYTCETISILITVSIIFLPSYTQAILKVECCKQHTTYNQVKGTHLNFFSVKFSAISR